MGLFKKKRIDLPSTGHSGDDEVLAQLANLGTDLAVPRTWDHFVYCDSEEGTAILEADAAAAGWSVERVDPEFHGIVASRSDWPVNPQTVSDTRQFFERLAASVPGGDYDGWGAEGD